MNKKKKFLLLCLFFYCFLFFQIYPVIPHLNSGNQLLNIRITEQGEVADNLRTVNSMKKAVLGSLITYILYNEFFKQIITHIPLSWLLEIFKNQIQQWILQKLIEKILWELLTANLDIPLEWINGQRIMFPSNISNPITVENYSLNLPFYVTPSNCTENISITLHTYSPYLIPHFFANGTLSIQKPTYLVIALFPLTNLTEGIFFLISGKNGYFEFRTNDVNRVGYYYAIIYSVQKNVSGKSDLQLVKFMSETQIAKI